jgi:hypothetical protein
MVQAPILEPRRPAAVISFNTSGHGMLMPTFEQQQFDNAIPAILSCLQHCEQCAAHCTDHASPALARRIKLCHACAGYCVFSMKALSSWLPQQAKKACEVCADSAMPARSGARRSARTGSCATAPPPVVNARRSAAG